MAMVNSLAGPGGKLWSTLLVVVLATLFVTAQGDDITVFTSPYTEVPEWAGPNALKLSLAVQPGTTSTVIPLTASVGLNGTGIVRGVRTC
jgi:hypothetical protein